MYGGYFRGLPNAARLRGLLMEKLKKNDVIALLKSFPADDRMFEVSAAAAP
jgi:hypothetical protein